MPMTLSSVKVPELLSTTTTLVEPERFIQFRVPWVDDAGQVSYKFTPGPFTNILRDAYLHPQDEYILVIEEINRGNAPAIFGEIFQLLDRKGDDDDSSNNYPVGTSEYGITNANIAQIVYGIPTPQVNMGNGLSNWYRLLVCGKFIDTYSKLWYCPSQPEHKVEATNLGYWVGKFEYCFDYGINRSLCEGSFSGGKIFYGNYNIPYKQLRNFSEVILIADQVAASNLNGPGFSVSGWIDADGTNYPLGRVGRRHYQGGPNILFCDLHVAGVPNPSIYNQQTRANFGLREIGD